MNYYKIVYRCRDGYEGEEIVMAVNRLMAFEVFKDLGYEDVIDADCFRIPDDEIDEEEDDD